MKITTLEERLEVIGNKRMAFVGSCNWDTFVDDNKKLWSVPKPNCLGCHFTSFGDKDHVRRLMSKGYHSDQVTEYGLELMEGLRCRLMVDGEGKRWAMLAFT
tara:strand:+ start:407 stop:712 length:306 start_codon:yes stop_codon:yes gene_type:complete